MQGGVQERIQRRIQDFIQGFVRDFIRLDSGLCEELFTTISRRFGR
jgi:hypothetical protein